ncbi:MAG: hypothetical protein A2136_09480 [Chloroflexi bacterium RBG_16_54_11]|nr:MAG: hypothetical protein A2136_09480 [Chloroflexi bacterium RBG_16_54_11]
MQLNTGQWVVIIIAGILIFGYILGYYYNRQRAEAIYSWLKKGLSTLGTVTLGEKLPGMSTGGRLEVNQPAAPFKRVEAVYLLAPRENVLFWVFHLLQGRGDELIVWVSYASRPEQSVEVARKGDRQFAKRLEATDKPKLTPLESRGKLQLAAEDVHGARQAGKVVEFVEQYKASLVRLAIRPEKPHLFLRFNLRSMAHENAEELFGDLKELVS